VVVALLDKLLGTDDMSGLVDVAAEAVAAAAVD
jgi:hypothetical protein